jgi:hypothetical protein
MAWSTPDLSDITQVLKGLIETAVGSSVLQNANNIKVLCDSPDTARTTDGQCHLNIYLLHVGRDPFWRNTPVQGPRPQLNSAQPLSLNLSYLLTAWCDKDFALEQRAMSIALQAIHGNPIVTQALLATESLTQWLPEGEFVVSIEADTIDEMSRLWQAFTVPMRLSALIRVGVVFIDPLQPIGPPAIPPSATNISVEPEPFEPTAPSPPDPPSLIGGFGLQSPPLASDTNAATIAQTIGPLVGVGGNSALAPTQPENAKGSTLALLGNGLALPAAANLYLMVAGAASDWDITSWITVRSAGEIDIVLPDSYAPPGATAPFPPTQTPIPGLYALAVGTGATRSNTIGLAIAPRVDGVTNPPTLSPDSSGIFSLTGAGFQPNAGTSIALGSAALAFTGGATPADGQFTVDANGANIRFKAPSALPAGNYPVLLAVNSIAATCCWVAAVP